MTVLDQAFLVFSSFIKVLQKTFLNSGEDQNLEIYEVACLSVQLTQQQSTIFMF